MGAVAATAGRDRWAPAAAGAAGSGFQVGRGGGVCLGIVAVVGVIVVALVHGGGADGCGGRCPRCIAFGGDRRSGGEPHVSLLCPRDQSNVSGRESASLRVGSAALPAAAAGPRAPSSAATPCPAGGAVPIGGCVVEGGPAQGRSPRADCRHAARCVRLPPQRRRVPAARCQTHRRGARIVGRARRRRRAARRRATSRRGGRARGRLGCSPPPREQCRRASTAAEAGSAHGPRPRRVPVAVDGVLVAVPGALFKRAPPPHPRVALAVARPADGRRRQRRSA